MQIINKKLNEIRPYEKNPRRNDEAVKYVAKSIQEFGFKVPIVIDKDGVIVCGHTRYKAATKLKFSEVPCIMADDLSDEQIKAFRLADNKVSEYAEWDIDLLNSEIADLSDFDMGEFGFENIIDDELDRVEEDDFDPDEAIDDDMPPVSKLGDVYQLGKHRLMCGDSTSPEDVSKLMNGEFADLVVTDPPYNVDYEGKTEKKLKIENDSMDDDSFYEFLCSALNNANVNMKDGAPIYVWYTEKETENFIKAFKNYFLHHETLIWNKNTIVLGHLDYHKKHEPCLYGWKTGAAHYFIDDRTQASVIEDEKQDFRKMKKDELVKLLEDIFSEKVSASVIDERKPSASEMHPTMKPIKLFARLVKNSSKQNDIVLDLFGGSGTTIMVCEQINRVAYLMEYDPKYVDAIIGRWEQYTGQKAIKLN